CLTSVVIGGVLMGLSLDVSIGSARNPCLHLHAARISSMTCGVSSAYPCTRASSSIPRRIMARKNKHPFSLKPPERSNAWAVRFRRMARDTEQLAETLAGLHVVAFAILMLKRFVEVIA